MDEPTGDQVRQSAELPDTVPDVLIRTEDLRFSIILHSGRLNIIDGISLTIRAGEILGVLGPNGCGKSTLLRLLAGLEEPISGVIAHPDEAGRLGMIFQHVEQNLVPWKTVQDNVALPAVLAGGDHAAVTSRAEAALSGMGLAELARRRPHELSGGQQQLITFARWLANPPSVLLVDEGWSMLDLVQRDRVYLLLRSLARERLCGICVVSHNIAELAGIADKAVILSHRPARIAMEVDLRREVSPGKRSDMLWQAARAIFDTLSTV